ncbi:hypothetical protein [Paraburkholderia sp. HD33-4]|uniref:hypothetical protein n=1 Tax=Paraburkholderia sp. HD33-4 TaxID=2883242 RepID=UPI001F40FFED|nr:hypothetical protein [Paraburkholderia sp. HD33-4]
MGVAWRARHVPSTAATRTRSGHTAAVVTSMALGAPSAPLKTTLPWLASEYEETVAVLGKDFWRYGVPGNESVLNAFLRYHHTQGLSERLMTIDELFAPCTTAQFFI